MQLKWTFKTVTHQDNQKHLVIIIKTQQETWVFYWTQSKLMSNSDDDSLISQLIVFIVTLKIQIKSTLRHYYQLIDQMNMISVWFIHHIMQRPKSIPIRSKDLMRTFRNCWWNSNSLDLSSQHIRAKTRKISLYCWDCHWISWDSMRIAWQCACCLILSRSILHWKKVCFHLIWSFDDDMMTWCCCRRCES